MPCGFFPVLVGFLFLGEALVPILSGTPPPVDYELSVLNVLGTLVFVDLVSGLSEEIPFRGFVQTYLSRYLDAAYSVFGRSLPLSGLLAAVLFTAAHVGSRSPRFRSTTCIRPSSSWRSSSASTTRSRTTKPGASSRRSSHTTS